MSHLVNSVDNAVTESLAGYCNAYPQLEYQAEHKVVIAPHISNQANKVSVICGGGSGHEPFSSGYVGSGMLTASISGSIFAAPPSVHITYAIERISEHSKAGILVIIPNYTGDCLNFGISIEKARRAGLTIADVIVDEDCSIPQEEQGIAGKRGLTGLIFAIKIAGALAERGLPLTEVAAVVQTAVKNMATYAVGLKACSIPGQGLMFELAKDEIECGMGIHGEAGYEKIKLGTANEVVAFMLKHICKSLSLKSGDFVAVLVNNFGALSQLEQGIVVHEVITQLNTMNVQPLRVYSGILMSSLNGAGIHITILKLPESHKDIFISCLDDPTNAPCWPGCIYSTLSHTKPQVDKKTKRLVDKSGKEMDKEEQLLMKLCLETACTAIIENEEHLNKLDRGCGDGDCGTTLKRLANGIMQNIKNFHFSHPSSILLEIANIAEERMGGTSGALYCLFFTAAAKELSLAQQNAGWLCVWNRMLYSGLNCLIKYGKAKPGDRTMVDTMDAVCTTFGKLIQEPSVNIYQNIAEAAWKGCEATRNMKPRAGRASYIKQSQYLQEVDAGAYGIAVLISAITNTIINSKQ